MSPEQQILLAFCAPPSGVVVVNDRVSIHTDEFRCVILVHGVIVAHYDKNDCAAEEYAKLTLLDSGYFPPESVSTLLRNTQGYAEQQEIARAFSYSD